MANNYCTVDDVKEALPDSSLDGEASYDALITALISRASRAVDAYLKRAPGAFYVTTDETRYFEGSGGSQQWVGELAAAPTTVYCAQEGDLSDYTTYASTDFFLWPYNAAYEGVPYLRLDLDTINGAYSTWYRFPKSVKVVGKFGFSTAVPEEIEQAAIIQTVRWFKRGHQGFQDAGAVVDLGQLRYVKTLDPDVKLLLDSPKFQRVSV